MGVKGIIWNGCNLVANHHGGDFAPIAIPVREFFVVLHPLDRACTFNVEAHILGYVVSSYVCTPIWATISHGHNGSV